MRTGTKILMLAIILPLLSYFFVYLIAKTSNCKANCKNRMCGQSDGCSGKCKECPNGGTCDGKKCNNINIQSIEQYNSDNVKGICYFDIDDTLTTAKGDKDEIVKQCLDNNFAIGIITASSRKVDDICDGNKAKVEWMSDLLCEQFQNNNARMYNSSNIVAGSQIIPKDYPIGASQGIIKAYDMEYGRKMFYPNISDKCVVLFDDQQHVLEDVKKYNSNLEIQCSGHRPNNPYTCKSLGRVLDKDVVRSKVMSMIANCSN